MGSDGPAQDVDFIRALLEQVGAEINPIRLIRRIRDGLEIPGLKPALVKILQASNLHVRLRQGQCSPDDRRRCWKDANTYSTGIVAHHLPDSRRRRPAACSLLVSPTADENGSSLHSKELM